MQHHVKLDHDYPLVMFDENFNQIKSKVYLDGRRIKGYPGIHMSVGDAVFGITMDEDGMGFKFSVADSKIEDIDRQSLINALTMFMSQVQNLGYVFVDSNQFLPGISNEYRADYDFGYMKQLSDNNIDVKNVLIVEKNEFSDSQKILLKTYADGEFDGLSSEELNDLQDSLFQFLFNEMDESEGCDSFAVAHNRVNRVIDNLEEIKDAIQFEMNKKYMMKP